MPGSRAKAGAADQTSIMHRQAMEGSEYGFKRGANGQMRYAPVVEKGPKPKVRTKAFGDRAKKRLARIRAEAAKRMK